MENFKPKKYSWSDEELMAALQMGYITEDQYKLVQDLYNEVYYGNKDPEQFAKEHGFSSFADVVKELEFIRKQINRLKRGDPPMSERGRKERETRIVTRSSLPFDSEDIKKAMQEAEEYRLRKAVEQEEKTSKTEEVKEEKVEEKESEKKIEEKPSPKVEEKKESSEKKSEEKTSENKKNEETSNENKNVNVNNFNNMQNNNLGFGNETDIDKLIKEVYAESPTSIPFPSFESRTSPTVISSTTRVSTDLEHVRKIFQLPRPEAERYPIILEELETHANFHRIVFGLGRRIFFLIPQIDGSLVDKVVKLIDENPDMVVDEVVNRIKELIEVKKELPRIDEVLKKIKVVKFILQTLVPSMCSSIEEFIRKTIYIIDDLRQRLFLALSIMSPEQREVYEQLVSQIKQQLTIAE